MSAPEQAVDNGAEARDVWHPRSSDDVLEDILSCRGTRTEKELRADWRQIGEEMARVIGSQMISRMLSESGMTLGQIQAEHGFDKAELSRLARGKVPSGPTLWKLMALAAALGYTLSLERQPGA